MGETLALFEVKAHLSDLADRVEREHERVLVTRHYGPSFVLISPDDLESLEDSLEIASDEYLIASIRRSREEAACGETVPLRDHV